MSEAGAADQATRRLGMIDGREQPPVGFAPIDRIVLHRLSGLERATAANAIVDGALRKQPELLPIDDGSATVSISMDQLDESHGGSVGISAFPRLYVRHRYGRTQYPSRVLA